MHDDVTQCTQFVPWKLWNGFMKFVGKAACRFLRLHHIHRNGIESHVILFKRFGGTNCGSIIMRSLQMLDETDEIRLVAETLIGVVAACHQATLTMSGWMCS